MYAYSGKTDLALTFLLLPVILGAWAMTQLEPGTILALRVLFFALICLSAFDAWRANRSVWKALFAFLTKHILVATLLICGTLAIGSVMAVFSQKSKKDRVGQLAMAGFGAYGFMGSLHWIRKLTRPRIPGALPGIAAPWSASK